VGKRRKR